MTPVELPAQHGGVEDRARRIAAGNTTVLKPSDTTPLSTLLLAEVAAEFLPPGVLNVDHRRPHDRRGDDRPQDPADGLDHRLGARRHGGGARRPPTTSSACTSSSAARRRSIVFDDADIDKAVEGIATAGYFNAGQDCTAATRVLVQEGVHDEFVAALAAYVHGERRHRRPARRRTPSSARSTTRTSSTG